MMDAVRVSDRSSFSPSTAGRADLTPFFATEPNPDATRRLLLVFFYFAPSAEVGALRWLSLTKFGAERGWAFDVVTLHPEYMGTLDRARLTQLPRGVRLFGFSGENPAWYRSLVSAWRRLRGSGGGSAMPTGLSGHLDGSELTAGFGSPDASPWRRAFRSHMHFQIADTLSRRAIALGTSLARSNAYAAVVSSGPPHAAHDAAMRIGEQTGLPFIMDMRDPWSDEIAMPEDLHSNVWRRAARAREARCVSSAKLVVVTSDSHRQLQTQKYPRLNGRVLTVMNGADPDPLPAPRPRSRFVIAFAGMIYLGRNPRALFRAAARVAKATGASPREFAVEFMGDDACEGVPLTRIAANEGLGDHFVSHGFHPRSRVHEFLAGASLLVSLPLRTSMTLPAKLFEYTRFDAWLLALAEPNSATEVLLSGTDADVVSPEDVDAIARVIAKRYEEFRAGVRPRALNSDGRFDRATQSAHLFNALDRVLTHGERAATTP
jgi:glycosyltransferase involved in cell wall biosynthesis